MTPEEELQQLRREKSQWQEQLAQRDEQIAQMRNCPIGTIKTQMRTALEKLRKVLA